MEFGDDVVHFNLDDAMKPPQKEKSICHINMVEDAVDISFDALCTEFPDLLHSDYALTSYSCSCTDSVSCSACLEISQVLSIGDVDVHVASESHCATVLDDFVVAGVDRGDEIDCVDGIVQNYSPRSFSFVEQL